MNKKQKQAKIARVLREFKAGTLKSSGGEKITNYKQAVAVALSSAGMSMPKKDLQWKRTSIILESDFKKSPETWIKVTQIKFNSKPITWNFSNNYSNKNTRQMTNR